MSAYQNLSLCSLKEAGRHFELASLGSKDNLKNDRVGNKKRYLMVISYIHD